VVVPRGLGQVVKSIRVAEAWNVDFCSKWAFLDGNKELALTRDIMKTLTTKQCFDVEAHPTLSPSLWLAGLTQSLILETPSYLLRKYFKARFTHYAGFDFDYLPEAFLKNVMELFVDTTKKWIHYATEDPTSFGRGNLGKIRDMQ